MSRVRKFYDTQFRFLARRLEKSPEHFAQEQFDCAAKLSRSHPQVFSPELALATLYAELRRGSGATQSFPQRFLCDAGLGGLARWLRAAGYESIWKPELNDAAVIREAERLAATLITTDTLMMERGVLRDGLQPSVCVPSSLRCPDQLALVLRELGLPLREPRCMTCGGELCRVKKETIAERIPPKTARWLDDYFLCAQCAGLFWHGTHWQRIASELSKVNDRARQPLRTDD